MGLSHQDMGPEHTALFIGGVDMEGTGLLAPT